MWKKRLRTAKITTICNSSLGWQKEIQNSSLRVLIIINIRRYFGQRVSKRCFPGYIAWFLRLRSYSNSAFFMLIFSLEIQSWLITKKLLWVTKTNTLLSILTMHLRSTETKEKFISAYFSTPKILLPILSKEIRKILFASCLEVFKINST